MQCLMEDDVFINTLFSLDTPEAVQACFLERDIDLSLDDVIALGSILSGMASEGSELMEDSLALIAGGGAPVLMYASIIGARAADTSSDVFSRRTFSRW